MSTKWGVFIGRMQPVHNGHLFLINKALQEQLQKYKDEFKNLKCE